MKDRCKSVKKINVLIADDHALVRQGLKQIIELEPDIKVIGLAADGEEAVLKTQQLSPDVVLLDISMPKQNGIQTLRRLKDMDSTIKIIMLTFHEDREYLFETINLGANGYVLKDAESESLIKAIRDVYQGLNYIYPTLATELVKEFNRREVKSQKRNNEDELTRREYEVLTLLAEGINNKEIGDCLFISEKTVKNHVSNIFKKINVNDRTQAAIYAYKHNIKKI
ncbi:two component transcriptional regulator, LuxR family [Alkaliphilus oremlandii OhILAs]|uniref:Stage 0 sporulation protein A homolog n=1 Tax=Alkaliphilus oremlandii (strain OhILAs) TaxID=350688 RepID=A8MF72_ALKOO|nr:two component transcriptional regulator, LuxR family [Alkaliphilus oremlandii OhILAs]